MDLTCSRCGRITDDGVFSCFRCESERVANIAKVQNAIEDQQSQLARERAVRRALAEGAEILHDYQNGPPLITYTEPWEEGMSLVEAALAASRKLDEDNAPDPEMRRLEEVTIELGEDQVARMEAQLAALVEAGDALLEPLEPTADLILNWRKAVEEATP